MKRRPSIKSRAVVTQVPTLPLGQMLFTKPQIAGFLQVSVRCISDMMKRGEIPYLKLRGRFVRFRVEDVQRHLTETALVCNRAPEGVKP